jgi:flagellar hook-associated protein 3 FlgL
MRVTNGMVQRHVLADLHLVTARLTDAQGKISSGKQITRPSDDPFGTSRALALRESIGGIRQQQRNLEDAGGWQESAELALAQVTDAVQRARELVVQGSTDTSEPSARAALAKEIDELAANVKESMNASYRGQYVFAGTKTNAAPYATTGDGYLGNTGLVAREIGPGVSIGVNLIGSEIVGNGQAANDNKLLHVLRDISDHLRLGDGASLRGTDIDRLEKSLETVLDARAVNGARANRLESAQSRLAELELSTMTQLSETEDIDMGRALIEMNSQQAAYQAALRAGSNIVQASLMDFLR